MSYDTSKVANAIKEAIKEHDLDLPEGFHFDVNMGGVPYLFAEIDGTRCWVHAGPRYEGTDGMVIGVTTAKAIGETDTGPEIDVENKTDIPHIDQIMRLSEERGGLIPADKHDLAYLWLKKVAPKAEALRELLS